MGIHLDSGDDLMVFCFHGDGERLATLYRADESVAKTRDFTLTAISQWSSQVSGLTYPSGWRLVIPEIQADLVVTPVLMDQEVVNKDYPGTNYWEGSNTVAGTFAGGSASGVAYVELAGYKDRS